MTARNEIADTTPSVFDVMDGLRYRLYPSIIAQLLDVTEDEIESAISTIRENEATLDAEYAERRVVRAVDFPALQAKLGPIEDQYRQVWAERLRYGSYGFPEWPEFDRPFIYDRDRGPEIVGSRITVNDVMTYAMRGWTAPVIAWWLRLTISQVESALRYINEHRREVEQDYQSMIDRGAGEIPAEIQMTLDSIAGTAEAARERLKQGLPLREEPRAQPAGGR